MCSHAFTKYEYLAHHYMWIKPMMIFWDVCCYFVLWNGNVFGDGQFISKFLSCLLNRNSVHKKKIWYCTKFMVSSTLTGFPFNTWKCNISGSWCRKRNRFFISQLLILIRWSGCNDTKMTASMQWHCHTNAMIMYLHFNI